MLGIGVSEIVVIGVVLLLIMGPDRLPHLFRDAGRMYGKLRRAADELRRAFVLEADRQDAAERMQALRERRKKAAEARKRALEAAGEGVVAHGAEPAEPDPLDDTDEVAIHHADPYAPADPVTPPGADAPTDPGADSAVDLAEAES